MENRNNALHYKMYKSGKSIVYAGLATTAAVAGLALANANNTASAATVNDQPTVEVANTSAAKTGNSDQIQSATAAVSAAVTMLLRHNKLFLMLKQLLTQLTT